MTRDPNLAAAVVAAYKAGHSFAEVGEALGISKSKARDICVAAGVQPRARGHQHGIQPCGTRAAYRRHRKADEQCAKCTAANTEWQRTRDSNRGPQRDCLDCGIATRADSQVCPACQVDRELRLPDNGRWVVKRGIQVFVMDEEAA